MSIGILYNLHDVRGIIECMNNLAAISKNYYINYYKD